MTRGPAVAALLLGFAASASTPPLVATAPPVPDAELVRARAESRREKLESLLRLSLFHACGGDAELRCQQLAPRALRGIEPTVALRNVTCTEQGAYPDLAKRRCTFTLGNARQRRVACTVSYHEQIGPHARYWSDLLPTPAPSSTDATVPHMTLGRSSLRCDGRLLDLTAAPEPVDPAPAVLPSPVVDLATVMPEGLRDLPGRRSGGSATTMRWRIGSHGLIDRCTVIHSSGDQTLDQTACDQFTARARFEPARGAGGSAVAADLVHRFDWPPLR